MGNKYTDSQKKASKKYIGSLDAVTVRVPKGQKTAIKAHADKYDGGSVNAFVNRAISETMARDDAEKGTEE